MRHWNIKRPQNNCRVFSLPWAARMTGFLSVNRIVNLENACNSFRLCFRIKIYYLKLIIRVNSDQLIMWFISNDGVWIFVLYHKCTATENLKMSRKEIFDHGCGRYSTTSKICKTNLKLLVKSEYFHYTQWHLWIDSLYDGSMRQRVISQLLYPFKPVS